VDPGILAGMKFRTARIARAAEALRAGKKTH
jgi:hypothetical protein